MNVTHPSAINFVNFSIAIMIQEFKELSEKIIDQTEKLITFSFLSYIGFLELLKKLEEWCSKCVEYWDE